MSEEGWWVSNDSLNEAAYPSHHYSKLSLWIPGPWGQECNPLTITTPCPWEGRGNISKWTIVICWRSPVFLGMCYIIYLQDAFPLLSVSLLMSILRSLPHPACTRTHTHRHTFQSHFKAIYRGQLCNTDEWNRAPSHGSVLKEAPSLLGRRDWFTLSPHLSESSLQRCQPPSRITFLWPQRHRLPLPLLLQTLTFLPHHLTKKSSPIT